MKKEGCWKELRIYGGLKVHSDNLKSPVDMAAPVISFSCEFVK